MDTQIINSPHKKNLMNKNNFKKVENIDYAGTMSLLAQGFNEHHEGIRELAKNTFSDIIRRTKSGEKDIQNFCIVFFKDATTTQKSMIGFLDFGGMDKSQTKKLLNLNSQSAATDEKTKKNEVYGGHGNGGKIYAAALFDTGYWHTCKNNTYIKSGYETYVTSKGKMEDPVPGEYSPEHVTNPNLKLEKLLKPFNLKLQDLPTQIKKYIKENDNFTFFIGENPFENEKKINVKQIMEDLLEDLESEEVLDFLELHVYHNKNFLTERKNKTNIFRAEKIPPSKEFPTEKKFEMPDELVDPKTGETVKTNDSQLFKNGTRQKYLVLKSSEDVIYNSRFRNRHVIKCRSASGIKEVHGRIKMNDATNYISGFPSKLYGELFHDNLGKFSSNNRTEFSDNKFIRAVKHWITEIIDRIAEDKAKEKEDEINKDAQKDMENINKKLENIFQKMEVLVNPYGKNSGPKSGEGEGNQDEDENEKDKKIKKIILSTSINKSGIGISFRPNITSYNKSGKEVPNKAVDWHISDETIVREHEKRLNLLYAIKKGKVKIHVSLQGSSIKSNTIEIEVIEINKILLKDNSIEIKESTVKKITPEIFDKDNNKIDNCYLNYEFNDTEIADGSSTGLITGIKIGNTDLIVMSEDAESNRVKVNVIENKDKKKKKGGGFPKVLLSGINYDPLVVGSKNPVILKEINPPVHQRIRDVEAGVWWINLQSPIANDLYRPKGTKLKSTGHKSKEFKVYLMEKWFEIMARVNFLNDKEAVFDKKEDFMNYHNRNVVDFQIKMKPYLKTIMQMDFLKSDEK